MTRPIQPDVDDGRTPTTESDGVDPDRFRDAFARWASTVGVVAVRDPDRGPPGRDVHAVTVTSYAPLSAEPPRLVVALGPNAKVLPFLDEATPFGLSLLGDGQRRIASDLADAYPVGPSPFPPEGPPLVEGALAGMACTVVRLIDVEGGGRLVVGRIDAVTTGDGEPLLYHRRGYRTPG